MLILELHSAETQGIGQTPQNFGKKLKRDTVTLEELKLIADVMEVTFEQSFIFPDGEQIKTSNE